MKIMIIALAVIFGGILVFNFIKGIMIKRFFAHYEAPPVTVSSVVAEKKSWEPKLNAVGNFVAINGVEVNAEAAGKIVAIHFDSGQYITQAQPLIDIDDSVEQSTLKFNQADQVLKEINYKRQAELFQRNATPSSSVDEAKANLEQAKANVEKVQSLIRQKHIAAPFSGQLGIRQVNLGQYITPGQTSLVSLQSLDPLYLEFNLPEQLYKQLHTNQKLQFSVEPYPGLLFQGKITAINSKVDPDTHNLLVQATVPNCPLQGLVSINDTKLLHVKQTKDKHKRLVLCNSEENIKNKIDQFTFIPGMFAAISIDQPPQPNAIVLPSTAISYSLYGNSVFVLKKTGKKTPNNKEIFQVKRVYVSTGEQEGNDVVINKGIKGGEQVVSSGELKLQNNTQVVINNHLSLNKVHDAETLGQ